MLSGKPRFYCGALCCQGAPPPCPPRPPCLPLAELFGETLNKIVLARNASRGVMQTTERGLAAQSFEVRRPTAAGKPGSLTTIVSLTLHSHSPSKAALLQHGAEGAVGF